MSATYDPTLGTAKDSVRFRLGDTNVTPASNALLSDEEIAALLSANGNSAIRATIAATRGILARYARMVTASVGDESAQFSDLTTHYRHLLKDLQRELAQSGASAPIFAGGISITDMAAREQDRDRTVGAFARGGIGSAGTLPLEREDTP